MTATADFQDCRSIQRQETRVVDGGRMILRAVYRLLGASLILACIGFWLAPGASWETDVMLFKLVLSVLTGISGIALLQLSSAPDHPEIEIDQNAGELRLVRAGQSGAARVLHRCRFEDLHRAELRGTHLRLWDQGNKLIAEIAVGNRRAIAALLDMLRDSGKLA